MSVSDGEVSSQHAGAAGSNSSASGCAPARTASPWVTRFAPLVLPGGTVLDVAAGAGRHAQWFLEQGCSVVAVDRDLSAVDWLQHDRLRKVEADLESAEGWPLERQTFDGVIVTNYLWRPIFGDLLAAVAPDGVLIYETFARGNERLGRPRRPEFLLEAGELLERVAPTLHVVAYENGYLAAPAPRIIQRICAAGRARIQLPCPLAPGEA